ncbi:HpcH/HpaI aldolase family protein [Amycolatopsis pithecellobii]|uniref:2-dehydro-3-deoxyglucarate aldolase n=1 Tax=Amycolatopsis pithecellobii TaxID=664692 RepID=A0A6N7YXA5_9PSEU|nr:aldolase/citrate lyase family protein [Amycolatopsis pithecellobii]MTD52969.1 2-dehydro-3-deoxyglucarate aldolase [Amycolatopsis pithecellobii]
MVIMFQRLLKSSGPPVVGTFVKIPSLEIAEIIALAGFDFVVIDTEHALLSVRDVYSLVVVYSRMNVAPLVRVTDHGYGDAQRYLDAGAAGVLVPHVANVAQAQPAMKQLLFPPAGTRGMGLAARAGEWGHLDGGRAEYLRAGQEDVARVAMIEDKEAVEGIDGILATPGLDAIFVGPGDLSLSMGEPGGSPAVREAVTSAIKAAVSAGVPVGTVVAGADQIRARAEQGCRFILVGNDTGMIAGAARRTLAETRDAIAAAKPVSVA